MRLLLDENLPPKLRYLFAPHEAVSVRYNGWASKKNGELLQLMLANGFDALITRDQSLPYQQNFSSYPITVFVMRTHEPRYPALARLVPHILEYLSSGNLTAGQIIIEDTPPLKT